MLHHAYLWGHQAEESYAAAESSGLLLGHRECFILDNNLSHLRLLPGGPLAVHGRLGGGKGRVRGPPRGRGLLRE